MILLVSGSSRVHEAKTSPANDQRVDFEPKSFDFGTALQTETIRHAFPLHNGTTNELAIVGLKSSCSCTVVKENILGKKVAPNTSFDIPVEYGTENKEGRVSAVVIIHLQASSTEIYEATATVQGEILSEYVVEPHALDFGELKPGKKATRTVIFRPGNCKELNLAIDDPPSTSKAFQVSLQEKGEGSGVVSPQIAITFHAPLLSSRETLTDTIRIKTSSARAPIASVYVRGQVIPDIEVTPPMIVLSSDEDSGQSKITIRTQHETRLLRVTGTASGSSRELQPPAPTTPVAADWATTHRWDAQHKLLVGLQQINVELMVRDGTDSNETRSVSIPIKSLAKGPKTNE